MKFSILLPDGTLINQTTTLTLNGKVKPVLTPNDLCGLIKRIWCKFNNVKSFTQWAKELNEDENFIGEVTYTKYHALDNLSSNFHVVVDGETVKSLYDYFLIHLPFRD